MKKEASGKKSKLLWIILGAVALLAVVGVVLALVLGGLNGNSAQGGRPVLYWNVDREANTDPDTGLSTRTPAEDGNYYVRFACDGEQVELPVADKKLVNFIDSQYVMGLTLDKSGCVVDVFKPIDIASVIGEGVYVQNATATAVTFNSAITMNGRRFDVKVDDNLKIYNVSGSGEYVGEVIDPTDLNPMDTVSIYGTFVPEDSEDEPVITHIFVSKKPVESKIYWRVSQFYNSSTKKTTRVPDENGVYTIDFYCDGETVQLKCRKPEIVNYIDSVNSHLCHFGLEFDEEGYILDELDSFLGSRTLLQCERYDITALDAEGNYTATSLIKNNGSVVEGVMDPECPIYDVSDAANAEGQPNRKVTSLSLNDRVCIWTDTMGNPVLVYITNHMIDSPAYWNVSKKYDSATKETTREPNEKGFYEVELLKAGETEKKTYYTKDKALMSRLDSMADRCVGLHVGQGNIIERVYSPISIFGGGYFTRGYYVLNATASVCSFLSNAGSGYTMNGVLAANCKVWNVSTVGTYGEETTLQVGDSVYAYTQPTGELINVYVIRRALGVDHMYWRLSERKYDSTNKVTTRVPDAEGYYVYEFAHRGKVVTLKTKDKDVASYIDSLSTPATAMIVKGDVIVSAHDALYAAGGSKYSGWYVKEIHDGYAVIHNGKGREETLDFADKMEVYNVSNSFLNFKGEKTSLKLNDYIYVFFDIHMDMALLYVWGRETDSAAWPVAPHYDSTAASTTRVPDADGWYYVDLAVNGQVKTYKTKNKAIIDGIDSYISAFGISAKGDEIRYYSSISYVPNVKGAGISNYVVTSVSGKKVTAMCTMGDPKKVGTTTDFTLASNAKVYDVSDDAPSYGAEIKLKVGDTVRTYKNDDDDTLYVYVVAHTTREGGYKALCDHCGEVVYWNAYNSGAGVSSYDTHYYLASDIDVPAQLRVYNQSKDFEIVLDLYGHTLTREDGRAALVRYGDTLTIMDTVGGGKIETKGNCGTGAAIMISDGFVNLHGGTLSHVSGDDPTQYSYAGGLVLCNAKSGVFNMYGGTLLAGEAFADAVHEAYGGAVRLASGTFNMHGGLITGGKAHSFDYTTSTGKQSTHSGFGGNIYAEKNGVVNITGGKIEKGEAARGGNIYITSGATVNISAGAVVDGIATDRGGNIFLQDSFVNVSGGEIVGGVAQKNFGGNIMAQGMDGLVSVSGTAKIRGGKAEASYGGNIALVYANLAMSGGELHAGAAKGGNNIYATESGGKKSTVTISGGTVYGEQSSVIVSSKLSDLTISGGTLKGVTQAANAAKVEISGKPVIETLKLGNGVLLTLGDMVQGADVTVDAVGVFTKPTNKASTYYAYFTPVDTERRVTYTAGNELTVIYNDTYTAECPHCDQSVLWNPWNGIDPLPNGSHFFLKSDIELADRRGIQGSKVCLDLQGKTILGKENTETFRIYGGAELTIMDTSTQQSGKIQAVGTFNDNGGNIYVGDNTTLNVLGGTIIGGTVSDSHKGGNIYANSGAVVNVFGGKVIGGTAYQGGNIYANSGTINLFGGTVEGGTASHRGGNVAATGVTAKHGKINLAGTAVVGDGSARGWTETRGVWAETHTDITVAENAQVTSAVVVPNLVKLNMFGGNIKQLEPRSGSTVNIYGGITKLLSGNSGATIYNGQVTKVTATGTVTVASCAQDLNVAGGKYVEHAAGLCATCGHTFAAVDADTLCTVCNAVHKVYTPCVHSYDEGVCVICGEAEPVAPNPGPSQPTVAELPCPHCGDQVPNGGWTAWDGTTSFAAGHYYLENSITLTGRKALNNIDVCLNLNNCTITGADNGLEIFRIYGGSEMSIMDLSSEGNGAVKAVTTCSSANCGTVYVGGNSTFNLLSGKIEGGKVSGNYYGGNIYIAAATSQANISGGIVSGGTAARGGNIYVDGGKLIVSGNAQILNGTAKIGGNSSNTGRAGNIYVTGTGAELTIQDNAVVSGGYAQADGGNIYCMYTKNVTITGNAQIKTGTAALSGDNMYVGGTDARGGTTLNISGGTVSGGNIAVIGTGASASTVNISGGKVDAQLTLNGAKTLNISGKPEIKELRLADNIFIKVGAMEEDASVCVSKSETSTDPVFSDVLTDPTVVKYFHGVTAEKAVIVNADSKLAIAAACPCGCGKLLDEVTWQDPATFLSGSGVTVATHCYIEEDVHLRLTADFDVTQAFGTVKQIIAGRATTPVNVVIDLAGKTWSSNNRFYVEAGSTLTVLDSSAEKTGVMTSTGNGNPGRVIANYGTFNLYGGTLTVTAAGLNDAARGGVVYQSKGLFNMYGGTLTGGVATIDGTGGGNLSVNAGVVNLYGGTISNGTAGTGNNIHMAVGTTLNVYGGTISNVATTGADVYLAANTTNGATMNVAGGQVLGVVEVSGEKAVINVTDEAVLANVKLAEAALITVGDLWGNASIAVDKATAFTAALDNAESYLPFFKGVDPAKVVTVTTGNELVLTDALP